MHGRQSTRHLRGPSAGITLCAVLLTAASAAAQSAAPPTADAPAATRAAQLAAERDALGAKSTPPTRSFAERTLNWYDNQSVLSRIFAGWHGLHIVSGRFPAGAGTAAGVGFTLGGDRGLGFNAEAATSTRSYKRAGASLAYRQVGGAPVDISVNGGAYEYPQQDFFGLGANSRREDRSNYLLSSVEGGADVMWRPGGGVEVDGSVSYLSPRVGSGTDHRMPSTENLFDPATLPGYLAQTDYVRTALSVALDRRDNPPHAHAGGRYGARVSDYRARDSVGSAGFRMAELEVQQYVPLPNRYRVLALRAAAVLTDANAGSDVPFYWQPTLGGADALRGFREFRFQDRNSVAVSAEYRWEAWWALDGAVFVDAGTVAPERRSLNLRDVAVSYGVGLRLHSNDAFVARLDFAFSREGFIPFLRFDHVF